MLEVAALDGSVRACLRVMRRGPGEGPEKNQLLWEEVRGSQFEKDNYLGSILELRSSSGRMPLGGADEMTKEELSSERGGLKLFLPSRHLHQRDLMLHRLLRSDGSNLYDVSRLRLLQSRECLANGGDASLRQH